MQWGGWRQFAGVLRGRAGLRVGLGRRLLRALPGGSPRIIIPGLYLQATRALPAAGSDKIAMADADGRAYALTARLVELRGATVLERRPQNSGRTGNQLLHATPPKQPFRPARRKEPSVKIPYIPANCLPPARNGYPSGRNAVGAELLPNLATAAAGRGNGRNSRPGGCGQRTGCPAADVYGGGVIWRRALLARRKAASAAFLLRWF